MDRIAAIASILLVALGTGCQTAQRSSVVPKSPNVDLYRFERKIGSGEITQPKLRENKNGTVTVTETGQARLGDKTKTQTKQAAKQVAIKKAVEMVAGVAVRSEMVLSVAERSNDSEGSIEEDFSARTGLSSVAFVRSVTELDYVYDKLEETGTWTGRITVDSSMMEVYAATALKSDMTQASVAKKELSLLFGFYDDQGRRLTEGSEVHEGKTYEIVLQTFQQCYLYIINVDESGAAYKIFPRKEIKQSNPLAANREYAIPGQGLQFVFDYVRGKEDFYFLVTLTPAEDVEMLLDQIERTNAKANVRSAVESVVCTRGGGSIVAKHSGQTIRKKIGTRADKRVMEALKANGGLVRQISLTHM